MRLLITEASVFSGFSSFSLLIIFPGCRSRMSHPLSSPLGGDRSDSSEAGRGSDLGGWFPVSLPPSLRGPRRSRCGWGWVKTLPSRLYIPPQALPRCGVSFFESAPRGRGFRRRLRQNKTRAMTGGLFFLEISAFALASWFCLPVRYWPIKRGGVN